MAVPETDIGSKPVDAAGLASDEAAGLVPDEAAGLLPTALGAGLELADEHAATRTAVIRVAATVRRIASPPFLNRRQ
jgi:hypothetical protein